MANSVFLTARGPILSEGQRNNRRSAIRRVEPPPSKLTASVAPRRRYRAPRSLRREPGTSPWRRTRTTAWRAHRRGRCRRRSADSTRWSPFVAVDCGGRPHCDSVAADRPEVPAHDWGIAFEKSKGPALAGPCFDLKREPNFRSFGACSQRGRPGRDRAARACPAPAPQKEPSG